MSPGSDLYARAYRWEVAALDDGEQFARVEALAQSMMQDGAIRDSATISFVNEFAARSAYDDGSIGRGLTRVRLAVLYSRPRSRWARLNVRRTLIIFLLNGRRYRDALQAIQRARPLSTSEDITAHVRAEFHLTAAGTYLQAEFAGVEVPEDAGQRHLLRAQRLLDEAEVPESDSLNRTRYRRQRVILETYRAGYASLSGQWADAQRHFRRAEHLATHASDAEMPWSTVHISLIRAHAACHAGRFRDALDVLDRGIRAARTHGIESLLPMLLTLRVSAAAKIGEQSLALSSLRTLGHLDVAGAEAHYHHASVLYGDRLGWTEEEDAAPWRAVSGVLALLTLASLGLSLGGGRDSGFIHWRTLRALGGTAGGSSGDAGEEEPGQGAGRGAGDDAGESGDGSGGSQGNGADPPDGSDPPDDTPMPSFGDRDGWTLPGDSRGASPDVLDVTFGDALSDYAPERLAPRIPSSDRPPPALKHPVVVVERYRPDGTQIGLAGLPAWTVEDLLRDGLFLLDRGDQLTLVLRLRDTTRTVVREATRAGVATQDLPFRIAGLPVAEIELGSTLSD